MERTGTRAAFLQMIYRRGVYHRLGLDRSTVSNWRRALAGKDPRYMPSLEKMEEMLQKYGANVVQEKIWSLPEK